MNTVHIVVLGKPVSWKRAEYNPVTKQRFVDRGSENYRAIIREAARPHVDGQPLWLGKIEMTLVAYWPRPQGWPQWRVEHHRTCPEPCTAGTDLDNIIKAFKDALQGVVYRNDNQIVSYRGCKKLYADDRPRVEITLTEIEPKDRVRPQPPPRPERQAKRKAEPAPAGDLFAGAAHV